MDIDDEQNQEKYLLFILVLFFCVLIFGFVLSLVGCGLCLLSWINIPKWRTFKHFIYTNIICFSTVYYVTVLIIIISGFICYSYKKEWNLEIMTDAPKNLLIPLFFFWDLNISWLFIDSITTYVDVVKVFGINITRKKLKSYLFVFGMCLPRLILMICAFHGPINSINLFFKCTLYFVPILFSCNLFINIKVLQNVNKLSILEERSRYNRKMHA